MSQPPSTAGDFNPQILTGLIPQAEAENRFSNLTQRTTGFMSFIAEGENPTVAEPLQSVSQLQTTSQSTQPPQPTQSTSNRMMPSAPPFVPPGQNTTDLSTRSKPRITEKPKIAIKTLM
jgi:hypothetical protein